MEMLTPWRDLDKASQWLKAGEEYRELGTKQLSEPEKARVGNLTSEQSRQ